MQPVTPGSPLRRALRALAMGVVTASVLGVSVLVGTTGNAHAATPVRAQAKQFVVAIDAGHQGKGDMRLEPVGPGSSKRKPRVAGGTRGVVTRKPESQITLQVALKLRTALEKRGVKVVMIRTKQGVNISNSERAKIASAANADLCIRLHCDGSPSRKVNGVLTLVPAKNKWTGPITSASLRAGKDVQSATVKATGAKDRGISKRSDMTGFNWSKVPCIVVEMGVMTNPAEDRKLASKEYQTKLVNGMSAGIMRFLER